MAIDLLKIIELVKDPDLRIKITQLYGENIGLKEENHSLRGIVETFKKNEAIQSKLNFLDNHYFLDKDGPFCTKCWDADRKLVRIHKGNEFDGLTDFLCPNCKTHTQTGRYIQPRDFGGANWEI